METIEDITLYKDFKFKEKWTESYGSYDIEIIGEKGRVMQRTIFNNVQKSRLNKIRWIGKGTNHNYHHIIVNGHDVFFKRLILKD